MDGNSSRERARLPRPLRRPSRPVFPCLRVALDRYASTINFDGMYDPRRPSSDQHQIDWKASDELAQAVAVAQLALAMARDSQTARPVTKDNKTPDKPDVLLAASRHLKKAHLLLRRAFKVVYDTPLDEMEIPPVKYYPYDDLCSGGTKELEVGKYSWKPLAKEGSAFRNLLREYATETVQRDLRKHRDMITYQLCEIEVSFDDNGEDQRGWLIRGISTEEVVSSAHLSHNEACDLVNTACRQIPEGGQRTEAWAQTMIAEGERRIADERYKNWMAESKEQGLPEGMVISLIHFRQAKENTKGNKPKVKAGVSR